MAALVCAVDQHPLFKGTQALFEAELWNYLQETAPSPQVVQDRVNRLLVAHRLKRLPVEKAFENGVALANRFGSPALFDRCLLLSLRQMDRFSRIALTWCLFLQTEPAHNATYRAVIEAILDKLLENFFVKYLPDQHWIYYDDAIGVLFQSRLDLSSRDIAGYGFMETLGTWPVVPEELVGKLTESHIVADLWI